MLLMASPPGIAGQEGNAIARKPAQVFFQRIWESNEKAFTILVPRDWKIGGGIFNVNPLRTNGPGNSITPKCDFTVKNDDRGAVMIHWVPSWNCADPTCSPTGFGLFPPGKYYQGMLVKLSFAKNQVDSLLRECRARSATVVLPCYECGRGNGKAQDTIYVDCQHMQPWRV